MRLLHVLNKCRHVSVLIIPDGNDQTFEYRLNTTLCKLILLAGLLSLFAVLLGAGAYWRVLSVGRQAERLQRENEVLWRENAKVVQLQQTLSELREVDFRLRKMTGNHVAPDEQSPAEESPEPESGILQGDEWLPHDLGLRADVNDAAGARETLAGDGIEQLSREWPSLWPVQGRVTAEFSEGFVPFRKKHTGIDIAAPTDSPVKAAGDGLVAFVGWDTELGNLVTIDHGEFFSTRYGHNSRVLVNQGERVRRGQTIAFVGNSGRSSAPHLHFEILRDGHAVDPRDYLIH